VYYVGSAGRSICPAPIAEKVGLDQLETVSNRRCFGGVRLEV
jgi:hypothetical protein